MAKTWRVLNDRIPILDHDDVYALSILMHLLFCVVIYFMNSCNRLVTFKFQFVEKDLKTYVHIESR